jgi:hypothetical protein
MNPEKRRRITVQQVLIFFSLIGLIAGTFLVSLTAERARARDMRRITDAGNLSTAIEIYKTSTNKLPDADPEKDASGNIIDGWDIGNVKYNTPFIPDLIAKEIIETPILEQDQTMSDSYRYFKYEGGGTGNCAKEYAVLCVRLEKPKSIYAATNSVDSCYDDPHGCPTDNPNWLVYMFEK